MNFSIVSNLTLSSAINIFKFSRDKLFGKCWNMTALKFRNSILESYCRITDDTRIKLVYRWKPDGIQRWGNSPKAHHPGASVVRYFYRINFIRNYLISVYLERLNQTKVQVLLWSYSYWNLLPCKSGPSSLFTDD